MLTAASGGLVSPGAWMFETGTYGKPKIVNERGPHFNISHCDGLVACATSPVAEIGIDVESLAAPRSHYEVDRYFAASERAWLRDLPEARRLIAVLQLWTLKEAYIKATGLGLSQRLDTFAFAFEPLQATFSDPTLGDAAAWRFEQQVIGSWTHILAAAYRVGATPPPVHVRIIRPESLLARFASQ